MGIEELSSISLLKGISEDILRVFSLGEKGYKEGSLIFEEGSKAESFFIIKEGEVEIRKAIDRSEGRYKPIAILGKGEFFGEMAVFLGESRSADALAKSDVSLMEVGKEDFSSIFKGNPEAAFRAMEFITTVLMERLRNTTKELAAIYETGRLISSARNIEEVSAFVMESAAKTIAPDEGFFAIWNDYNEDFEVTIKKGFEEVGSSISGDDPILAWLAENKEPILSFDLRSETRFPLPGSYKGRSLLAAPFFSHGRLTGFMLLSCNAPNAFSHSQMILLSAIGGYVSAALENLRYTKEELDRSRLTQAKSSIQF